MHSKHWLFNSYSPGLQNSKLASKLSWIELDPYCFWILEESIIDEDTLYSTFLDPGGAIRIKSLNVATPSTILAALVPLTEVSGSILEIVTLPPVVVELI